MGSDKIATTTYFIMSNFFLSLIVSFSEIKVPVYTYATKYYRL